MQYDYAGLGWRAAATLVDAVVLAIPNWILIFLLGGATAVFMLVSLAIGLGYYVGLELTRGATLGKMALGMRVARADGGPLDAQAALLRNVLRIVDGFCCYLVGAILVLQSPRRQRLGDRVAGTVVVRKVG